MKNRSLSFVTCLLIISFNSNFASAQTNSAEARIKEIIASAKGKIGAAVINMEMRDTVIVNGAGHYPMQSVYKFPLALAVLHKVDEGKFSLDQKIKLTNENLHPNTWSPLRKKYSDADTSVTLREILTYTIEESDNNGCDILFNLMGGTENVNQYVHSLGIKDISIAATEEEMHKSWPVQYTNWSTPLAMTELFCKFYKDSILSSSSSKFLWNALESNIYGGGRIKGLLPAGTIVAHKTGSSGVNDMGIAAATNDAGIIVLPGGEHLAVTVFVSDSPENEKARDKIIAEIAKAAWDAYVKH